MARRASATSVVGMNKTLLSLPVIAMIGALAAFGSPAVAGPGSGISQSPCRMSADAVEHWTEGGATLPSCVRQANLVLRSFGDDRREPTG
jgi:hypothetical protein